MTGPRPKPPRMAKRRPRAKAILPWPMMSLLFGLYLAAGLLLSMPSPPVWVWVLAVVAVPLIVLGLHRPLNESPRSKAPLMVYPGALLLVVALAIAANFIGDQETLSEIGFFDAIIWLTALTFGVIALTAAAAVVGALTGNRLMQLTSYAQSRNILLTTSFLGLCIGGLIGSLIIFSRTGPGG